MKLNVNDEVMDIPHGSTVDNLLRQMFGGVPQPGVAVAVNGKVVSRSQWDRVLNEGERVDVLTAVQGG